MLVRLSEFFRQKNQSLIFKILLYFVLSVLSVAAVLGWDFTNRIKPHLAQNVLPNLSQYVQYLVADIGTPPNLERAQELTDRLPFDLRLTAPGLDWSSTPLLLPVKQYSFQPAPVPYQRYQISHRGNQYLLLVQEQEFRYLFAIHKPRSLARDHHWLLFTLLAGILGLLYFGIRRLFSPLSTITRHVQKIGAGQFDEPIHISGKGELAQLAEGIHQMTLEIKLMLESKAGLLLAISHELRSPITRMRVNLELLNQSGVQQTLIADLREMETLISSVLESERLNTHHAVLNRSQFNLQETIFTIIRQYFADDSIDTDLDPVVVYLDEVRVGLLIKNLIDNACRYSRDSNTAVEVCLKSDSGYCLLTVSDHGSGVSSTELKHLTEPFYRSDQARLRKTGGYGLGLYLCRLIVEAHQGQLEIQTEKNQGMVVSVRLPLH